MNIHGYKLTLSLVSFTTKIPYIDMPRFVNSYALTTSLRSAELAELCRIQLSPTFHDYYLAMRYLILRCPKYKVEIIKVNRYD